MNVAVNDSEGDIIGGNRGTVLSLAVAVSLTLSLAPVGAGESPLEQQEDSHAADHVVVKLAPGETGAQILGQEDEPLLGRWHRVAVPEGKTAEETVAELESTEGVEAASLDPIVQLDPMVEPVPLGHVPPVGVNDPLAIYQWHLPAIQTDLAWGDSTGKGVLVAVVDTGVSPAGEDLACRSFVSPYNAITRTTGIAAAADNHGHGTHVAGTVAQCTNNGIGVAGVAFEVVLMPVKVLGSSGFGQVSHIAAGIEWARTHGADVINLSLGCSNCSTKIIEEAIDSAIADGVVIVAAAGNDNASSIYYPASRPDVIGVGATDFNNVRAPYSNRGQALTLVAPGGDMAQDANNDGQPDGVLQETFHNGDWGYYYMHGTSMATPHVSGAVAMLLEKFPDVDRGAVKEVLAETALDLGSPGFDTSYGHGLVQIHDALVHDTASPTWPTNTRLAVDRFGETSLVVGWSTANDNRAVTGYRLRVDGETWSTELARQAIVTGLKPGTSYLFEVTARDRMGNWSQPLRAHLRTARAFTDMVDHLFYNDVLWMSGMDVTRGCNPPVNDRFCPDDFVTRGQLAAFVVRALGLTAGTHPGFVDVPAGHTFAGDIGRLATVGITRGCNPPVNDRFCPDDFVTRGQLAAFVVRALGLTAGTHPGFVDVPVSSTFAGDIGRLATVGITRGCNPPVNDRFCPEDFVTRGQLAAFFNRARDLIGS